MEEGLDVASQFLVPVNSDHSDQQSDSKLERRGNGHSPHVLLFDHNQVVGNGQVGDSGCHVGHHGDSHLSLASAESDAAVLNLVHQAARDHHNHVDGCVLGHLRHLAQTEEYLL